MQRSIIMMSIDALRADCAPGADSSPHLRRLGLKPPHLPAFSRLVEGATVFTQAIANSSYTPACHASLFTGLLPPEHGVRAFAENALSREVRTLAEILRAAGYATCAMSDQPLFLQPQGLTRGFQTFVTSEGEALAWWDSYAGAPRFLFLHLWDVHQPYGMPVGRAYRSQYPAMVLAWQQRLRDVGLDAPPREHAFYEDGDRYYVGLMQQIWQAECGLAAGCADYIAGLRTFDAGRLHDVTAALGERGALRDAVLVVTADHGEGRDVPPSRLMKHGSTLLDDQVRIPLFVKWPARPAPRRIDAQVSQADVAPTILDGVGLTGAQTRGGALSGRSLLPLMRGESLPERPVYAEIFTSARQAHDDGAAPCAPQTGAATGAVPRHRMLRYPDRKYYLVGRPAALADEDLCGPDERFVAALFSHMLGRFATDDEAEVWLSRVRKVPPGDREARRELIQRLLSGGEFRDFPKYAVFDLASDPLEERPRALNEGAHGWDEYERALATMMELDEHARAGEPLVTNESDEQVILKRLQELGYLE